MLLEPARLGMLKTLKTTLLMAKIIFPVTLFVVILERLALLNAIALFFSPWLSIFGLPGEASLPVLLGFFVNIYAAMGAIVVLELSAREITVLSLMILTSHSLLLEAPVLGFAGLSPLRSILLRIAAGLLLGYTVNIFYLLWGGM